MKYRSDTEIVLNKLSFKISPGEKIGIVGRTGAGKSSLSVCISRLVELYGGSIEIDGIPINELKLKDLRKAITTIPQDPTLFTGTVRMNLDPAFQSSDERMIELLEKAGLDEIIGRGGLDFEVSEGGQNLSSGEKQLICICRAILRKSKFVILDEATASIDVVAEKKIQELIEVEFKECTMLVIAHRLNTIMRSDRILVLSFGEVLEFDSPQVLRANPDSELNKMLQNGRESDLIK